MHYVRHYVMHTVMHYVGRRLSPQPETQHPPEVERVIHSGNRRSLLTNEPLTSVNLVPNRTVKKMVDAHRERLKAAGARKRQRFEGDAPPADRLSDALS